MEGLEALGRCRCGLSTFGWHLPSSKSCPRALTTPLLGRTDPTLPKLSRTTAQHKLAEFAEKGVIQHVGAGRRGDPKRFYLAMEEQGEAPY